MTLREKLRAIVVCTDLCKQNEKVKLLITDDAEYSDQQAEKKLLAKEVNLENLHALRASVSKAMQNKGLKNCTAVGNSLGSQSSAVFYLFAIY